MLWCHITMMSLVYPGAALRFYYRLMRGKYERSQWLSGRVLDSRLRGRGLEPHHCHCIVYLSKTH